MRCEIGIVGSGFAGSLLGWMLARAGTTWWLSIAPAIPGSPSENLRRRWQIFS